MYQRKGTGKLLTTALISSKFYIIKAIQPKYFFISSPQKSDALRVCVYISLSIILIEVSGSSWASRKGHRLLTRSTLAMEITENLSCH